MSDERKEMLEWLDTMINSMERVKGNYYAFYMREGDIDRLKQLYQSLIQQKPEITHPWSLAEIAGVIKQFKGNEADFAKWIFEVIDIGREVQKPEINEKYVEEKAREFLNAYTDNDYEHDPSFYVEKIKLIKELITQIIRDARGVGIGDDWLPTAESVNALPEPLRLYIGSLDMNADPAGMVQENVLLKDAIKQYEAKIERMKK